MNETIRKWLLTRDPWVTYRTLKEFPAGDSSDSEQDQVRLVLMQHPLVRGLISELNEWPGPTMKRHNDARLLYHKLVFLSELGVGPQDPGMEDAIERILESSSPDGPFQIFGNIPKVFGGSGRDESVWMLCDAPLVVYALVRMGLAGEARVRRAVDFLAGLIRENGWPCAATSTLGEKFRGPGKKGDPCPYATLIMLRLLSALPDRKESEEARRGTALLLDLWKNRKEVKYYLFGMGTDFRKLKAPFIWYDILHVTEVLTRFPFLGNHPALEEMIEIVRSREDPDGRYTAESAYRAWKEWDFGQKREPSGWITVSASAILSRWERISSPTG